jgi:hypothetical protein
MDEGAAKSLFGATSAGLLFVCLFVCQGFGSDLRHPGAGN